MTHEFIDTTTRTTGPENRSLNGLLVSKRSLLVLLLIVISVMCSAVSAADATASESNSQEPDNPLATFEINYHLPGASTVYMLWGVNDWMHVPEHRRPAGTSLYQDLMYTPMSGGSGVFTTSLTLPVNTRINYVFQITKRDNVSRADLWDTNKGENYFSVMHGNGSEKIAPKSLDAVAAQHESSLSKVMILLGLLVVLFAVHKLLAVILPVPDRNDHST